MKILEVLVNNEIVQYDETAPLGKRWLVVDESSGRVKSIHPTKETAHKNIKTKPVFEQKKPLIEQASFSFDGRNFPVGSVFQLNSEGTRWGVGLGVDNEIVEFEGRNARNAAQRLVDNLPQGQQRWTAGTLRTAARRISATPGVTAGIREIDLSRFNRRATINSFANLENIRTSNRYVGPTLAKILNSAFWRGFSRIGGAVGIPLAVIWTNVGIINDLEEEAERNPNTAEENYELRNIILAQTSTQVIFFLGFVLRNASLFNRALRAIKWTVRSVQGSIALTGAGALPSALSFLITEAGWLVAGWIISSETVQRALAEWIHDSMFSGIFEIVGQGISAAATVLDAAFDGRFGTRALRRGMGWDTRDPEDVEDGEYTSSSEWAKLVFHGLLFPPGEEQKVVPYIPPEERENLLRARFGLEEQAPAAEQPTETPAEAPAETPSPQTSEPGLPTNPDAAPQPQ